MSVHLTVTPLCVSGYGCPSPEKKLGEGSRGMLNRGAFIPDLWSRGSQVAAQSGPGLPPGFPRVSPGLTSDRAAPAQALRGHPVGAFPAAGAGGLLRLRPRPRTWRRPRAELCCGRALSGWCEEGFGNSSGRDLKGAPPARSATSACLTVG